MSTTAPSSWAVMNAGNELAEVRARLIAICPDIEEDQTLFADMLEGEAPDAMRIIERLIEASLGMDDMTGLMKKRQDELAARKARFEKQSEACRAIALQQLEKINLRKLVRPQWTASVANRPPSVRIIEEAKLPPAFIRTKTEPDKIAIAAALKQGETVAGAELSNGGVGLTVRTK